MLQSEYDVICPRHDMNSSHTHTTPKDLEAPYFIGFRGLSSFVCLYQSSYDFVPAHGIYAETVKTLPEANFNGLWYKSLNGFLSF